MDLKVWTSVITKRYAVDVGLHLRNYIINIRDDIEVEYEKDRPWEILYITKKGHQCSRAIGHYVHGLAFHFAENHTLSITVRCGIDVFQKVCCFL